MMILMMMNQEFSILASGILGGRERLIQKGMDRFQWVHFC